MKILISLLFFSCAFALNSEETSVSYIIGSGRFGDKLVSYLHAKWISYQYGLPLLYKPFMHSEEFALHDLEELWSEEKEKEFDEVVLYSGDGDFSHPSTLYQIPFFSAQPDDRRLHSKWIYFPIDWKDENFRSIIRTSFAPRKQYPQLVFPDPAMLKVAVHVRRGSYDGEYAHHKWPLRFPPDSYYCEALRKLCSLFPGRAFYVHIFTDELHPEELIREYRRELRDLPITWGCREEGSDPKLHVMEDFFAMMQFDCLIRSLSNYTLIQAHIGDYEVVISPKHFTEIRGYQPGQRYFENYIDEMEIEISKR